MDENTRKVKIFKLIKELGSLFDEDIEYILIHRRKGKYMFGEYDLLSLGRTREHIYIY